YGPREVAICHPGFTIGLTAMTPSGICTARRIVAELPQPCGTRRTTLYGAPTEVCGCSRVTCASDAVFADKTIRPATVASRRNAARWTAMGHELLNMGKSPVSR